MPVLLLMLMLIPNLPGGKGTDPAPQCSKCHNRHFGKCLDERVKEQEEQPVSKMSIRQVMRMKVTNTTRLSLSGTLDSQT